MKCSSIFFLLTAFFLFSCTNTKKITYLQDDKSDNVKADELVKTLRLQESAYKLQPADHLGLHVFSLTDEKINFLKDPLMEVVVDSKGQIEIPVIGLVNINGLTIREAEEKLKTVLTEYLKNPSATLKLLNFNVTVIGEVAQQGSFVSPDPRVNILQAISKAGGLTENSDRENIRIIRSENNVAKIYRMNLLEDNSLLSPNFFLQSNDIVLVNPLKSKAESQQRIATVGLVISVISVVTSAFYIINNNR